MEKSNKEYNIWKWKVDDEKVNKTKRKDVSETKRKIEKDNQIKKHITKKNMNSKEECSQRISERISERIMIKQRTCNPFLSNTNYLRDLSVQEEFLKPQNSNFENLELT